LCVMTSFMVVVLLGSWMAGGWVAGWGREQGSGLARHGVFALGLAPTDLDQVLGRAQQLLTYLGRGRGHVVADPLAHGVERLVDRRVAALHLEQLLLLELEQLEALALDRLLKLVLALARVLEPLFVERERVRVGLDPDLDRSAGLVGVEVVERRGRDPSGLN